MEEPKVILLVLPLWALEIPKCKPGGIYLPVFFREYASLVSRKHLRRDSQIRLHGVADRSDP